MKKPSKSASKTPRTKKAAAARKPAGKVKTTSLTEDVHKFEAARPRSAKKPVTRKRTHKKTPADIDKLGELPRSYGEQRIFAIAQEPHWLFCYWDYTLTDGVGSAVFLRHGRHGSDKPEGEVAVPSETNSWYLSVRESDTDYYIELGFYKNSAWKSLARSAVVPTPRDSMAGFGEPVFANLPFQATFQQLVEKLRGEMRSGETLAEALARLQKSGELAPGRFAPFQRNALELLLASDLGSLTSGDLGRFLGSPMASLFSGGFSPSLFSAAAASWGQAPGGFSSGMLALLGLAGASWSGASWGESSAALSRWGAESSWSSAELARWGAESSWLASWPRPARGFFMHVNAEVIFYGGTHPDAKVTIDGKEIALRPDGTFRHHFVFPDGEYEIPIVATSPDGVETRRAVLRFERATAREGQVDHTAQPPLPEPIGRTS